LFDEVDDLSENLNRIFSGTGRGRRVGFPEAYPPMNVWSSEDGLVIDVELPGVDPKEVDIAVKGDELTVTGVVNAEQAEKPESYYRSERPAGRFSRTVQLPFRAETEAVKASYRNGVLRLTVPRSAADKPKRIAIESA
jgi:HSP20 family protein